MTQQNYKRGTKPLPERFVLVPTIGSTLQVMHAVQCLGYLWLENDTWRARDDVGALIDSSADNTVHDVLTALFGARGEQVFLKAL